MKSDAFEEKLQRQPLRPIPPAWRTHILGEALATESASPSTILDPRPSSWWRELLWPCPQAWAGLATVWLAVFIFQRTTAEPAQLAARPAVASSPELLMALREQRLLLTELIGEFFPEPAEPPKPSVPRPRSELRMAAVVV